MFKDYKVLGLTKTRNRISSLCILRILIRAPYSLPLVLLIYISIIYSLIYLHLINIRTLRRPKSIKSPLKTLLKILTLLLTGSTNVLNFSGRIYLQAFLTPMTFSIILSGNYIVVAIYIVFYRVLQRLNLSIYLLNLF